MSHPAAHTVEHIEKQHRSITPQPATQQQTTPTTILTANSACNTTASNRTKKRNRTASQQDSMIPTPASLTQEILTPMNQTATDTNGTTGFLRIQSPTNASTSTLTNHQASDIIGPSNSNPLASLFAHASATTVSGCIYRLVLGCIFI